MSDDYPVQRRPAGRKKYLVALVVLGSCGATWVLVGVVSFAAVRLRANVSPAVVVDYEVAGGSERLRVQAIQEGRPKGFMLLDPTVAWPRYTKDQRVDILTWQTTNHFGQRVQQSMAYARRNFWQKYVLVLLIALAAILAGLMGLRRKKG